MQFSQSEMLELMSLVSTGETFDNEYDDDDDDVEEEEEEDEGTFRRVSR